ncbi:MAG: hypothetical protein AAGJ10_11395 [Bacteroidota bacterium]
MYDTDYFVAMNLALTNEPNALCVIQRTLDMESGKAQYHVVHLERFALGTSYQAMAAHAQRLIATEPLSGRARIIVDQSRVGAAVLEHFEQVTHRRTHAVHITTEAIAGYANGYLTAPLNDLIGRFQMLQGEDRIAIAEKLELAAELKREMNNFRYRQPSADLDIYEALRAGTCTDLVMALLLGLWTIEVYMPFR